MESKKLAPLLAVLTGLAACQQPPETESGPSESARIDVKQANDEGTVRSMEPTPEPTPSLDPEIQAVLDYISVNGLEQVFFKGTEIEQREVTMAQPLAGGRCILVEQVNHPEASLLAEKLVVRAFTSRSGKNSGSFCETETTQSHPSLDDRPDFRGYRYDSFEIYSLDEGRLTEGVDYSTGRRTPQIYLSYGEDDSLRLETEARFQEHLEALQAAWGIQ